MTLTCLDGSTINIDIKPSKYTRGNVSKTQERALEWAKQKFGNQTFIQEFPIPKTALRLDIFIPTLMVAIEAHGEQHYSFNKHFHKNKAGFKLAQQNDEQKAKWCKLNNIELIIWTDSKSGQTQ